jgi:alkylation response protein AidB-like acyl-CoA dehydrogenase
LAGCIIEELHTPFGYPLGRLRSPELGGERIVGAASTLRQWWHVALAAEIGAVARAAVDLTVRYVTDRRQFNRAIGSYQAVQHRLSECSVAVEAIRQLTRRAAATEDVQDALIAAAYAKEACARIIYDTQQFHGAIGVTYEYPLHLWTYRLRLLQGELGSFADTASELADARWG